MFQSSFTDVLSAGERTRASIRAGDLVCTGPNHFPYFEVIAVNGDKAWVRNVQTGEDNLALVSRCRPIDRPGPAPTAVE